MSTGKAGFTWMAHTEFTLRPRSARTGVVGHDKFEMALSQCIF